MGRVLPASLKRIHAAFSAALFLALLLIAFRFSHTKDPAWFNVLASVVNNGVIALYIIIILASLWLGRSIPNPGQRKLARSLLLIYLASWAYALILTTPAVYRRFDRLRPLPLVVAVFTMNLPPLLYLRSTLRRMTHETLPQPVSDQVLEPFYSYYNLSQREREIARLVLLGRSNKEIEDELFISLKTVKSHIYNIYQKTRVKNRLSLMNLVSKFKT